MNTIAIDAMGGDFGPSITVPAAARILRRYPSVQLILVGDAPTIEELLKSHQYDKSRVSIVHATQCVTMDEPPAQALRTKKDSSMRVAINLVKEGKAKACVSAGNTGALMATARFVLKTLPGIDRPAIISSFPTYHPNKNVRMLDLGANVDSSAESLVQFAIMGSVLSSAVNHIPRPRIALLNIGAEEIKGNEQVKKTANLLSQASELNYVGFIEADAIYRGDVDVVVCDGFAGNVALKAMEGVAVFIKRKMKEAFMRNFITKIAAYIVKPVLKSFIRRIDPARYNGATFIGLQGTVIKSHGGTSVNGFVAAVEEAIAGVENNIPELIRNKVEELIKIYLPTDATTQSQQTTKNI